jgi:hypothetical protein
MALFVCGDFNGVGSSLRTMGLVWSDNRIEDMVHEWILWYCWWFHASEGGVFVWRSISDIGVISSPSQKIPFFGCSFRRMPLVMVFVSLSLLTIIVLILS